MKKKMPNKPIGPPTELPGGTTHILPDEGVIPMIGPEPRFYGQIIGLSVGLQVPHLGGGSHTDLRSYAIFQTSPEVAAIWIVPDYGLFSKLSECLNWMCKARYEHGTDYGWQQLWIELREDWEIYTV